MSEEVYKVFDVFGYERMTGSDNLEKMRVFELMINKQFGEVEKWKYAVKPKEHSRVAKLYH